jgi:hypothetical protein
MCLDLSYEGACAPRREVEVQWGETEGTAVAAAEALAAGMDVGPDPQEDYDA